MKRLAATLCAAALAIAPAGHAAPAERAAAPEEEGGAVAANAETQIRNAENFEAENDTRRAISAYRGLVRRFPQSTQAARAQLKIADLTERSGNFDRAFNEYSTYIKNYPNGKDFEVAVEAQFRIARMFLEGEKKRLLGVPTVPSMARAQQMFEEIVKNAPFSKYAPLAQFNIGQALERQGKTTEAVAAYQLVTVRYPNDTMADDAQYQIGYVYLQESRSGSYNNAARARAREALEDFVSRYPDSEKAAQARENLKTLAGREIRGAYDIARFYDKQKNYKAAVIYYNEVIRQQPGSAESDLAKARIDVLKEQVGEDTLRPGPEKTETGARAQVRRRMQAQVETSSRPDYLGPTIVVPDEVAPPKPKPRTSRSDVGPVPAVEPALPEE